MPTISEIKNKILYSGNRAFLKYRRMTGGWGLGQAPESFLQNEITSALSRKKFCPYVSLEDTLRTVLYDCNNDKIAGSQVRGNKCGRFDIG